MVSDAGTYYRCTACSECFFTNDAFVAHAVDVHRKVLVCQGHDPGSSGGGGEWDAGGGDDGDVKAEPTDEGYENVERFLEDTLQTDAAAAMTAVLNAAWRETVPQVAPRGAGDARRPEKLAPPAADLHTAFTGEAAMFNFADVAAAASSAAAGSGAANPTAEREPPVTTVATVAPPHMCAACGGAFATAAALGDHAATQHGGEKPFKCRLCPARFSRQRNRRIHMRVHTDEKPFSCKLCPASFKQATDLKRHTRIHTGEKPYACTVCKAAFAQTIDLKRHMRAHTGEKPYRCDVCDAAYTRKHSLNDHRRLHTGEKPYACLLCTESFTRQAQLKVHARTHIEVYMLDPP